EKTLPNRQGSRGNPLREDRGILPRRRSRTSRFFADAMLGSMARKLRAFGFDTSYFKNGGDHDLIRQAASERRVILTSDHALVERARTKGLPALLIVGRSDGERIGSLMKEAARAEVPLIPGEPLCSVCASGLLRLAKVDVKGKVPPSVEARHRLFYRCKGCGKYYWRGSHWKKLRWLERRLRENQIGTNS
ncbi:MAG: Mut7-C RNAse domain-containing protein, partial [Thaumarchaeota archaeon]|nr:Mut7-C RNAse domain-containing protein [Nitrososphaerota archaeon]